MVTRDETSFVETADVEGHCPHKTHACRCHRMNCPKCGVTGAWFHDRGTDDSSGKWFAERSLKAHREKREHRTAAMAPHRGAGTKP